MRDTKTFSYEVGIVTCDWCGHTANLNNMFPPPITIIVAGVQYDFDEVGCALAFALDRVAGDITTTGTRYVLDTIRRKGEFAGTDADATPTNQGQEQESK